MALLLPPLQADAPCKCRSKVLQVVRGLCNASETSLSQDRNKNQRIKGHALTVQGTVSEDQAGGFHRTQRRPALSIPAGKDTLAVSRKQLRPSLWPMASLWKAPPQEAAAGGTPGSSASGNLLLGSSKAWAKRGRATVRFCCLWPSALPVALALRAPVAPRPARAPAPDVRAQLVPRELQGPGVLARGREHHLAVTMEALRSEVQRKAALPDSRQDDFTVLLQLPRGVSQRVAVLRDGREHNLPGHLPVPFHRGIRHAEQHPSLCDPAQPLDVLRGTAIEPEAGNIAWQQRLQ
eukprot:CAMPEP_0179138198 /NCGR_PEP_ID=MMETSP0796-20121207/65987_1 /TAXON_ID=73915 /ORGANISM="Pyrodinium bahamense, Strain pbaha01" /LENGTH=292 /DNA_ID=CAMNT_0020837463 /DNA_START=14 /DNA_END=892 /DNA_ORIENTATION=-